MSKEEFAKLLKNSGVLGASLDADGMGATIYYSDTHNTKEEAEVGVNNFNNSINKFIDDSKGIYGTSAEDTHAKFTAFNRGRNSEEQGTYEWANSTIHTSDAYKERLRNTERYSEWARRSLSDVEQGLLKDEYGKRLDKVINDVASATGVKIVSSNSSAGGWYSLAEDRKIIEPSKGVTIEYETKEQLEAFANLLGALAPDIQEGVYVAEYDENGADVEHAFTFDTVENGQKVVDMLHTFKNDENDPNDNGLGDGFRYDTTTNTLYIGDLGNQNLDKINKLLDYAGQQGLTDYEPKRATISFPSNRTYAETLRGAWDKFQGSNISQGQKDSFNTLYEQAQERVRAQVEANSKNSVLSC